jgi:hypothetical protein
VSQLAHSESPGRPGGVPEPTTLVIAVATLSWCSFLRLLRYSFGSQSVQFQTLGGTETSLR